MAETSTTTSDSSSGISEEETKSPPGTVVIAYGGRKRNHEENRATKARCDSTKVSAYDTEEDDDEVVFQKMANREATKRKILKEVVNTKLFPKVKFIPDESYLKSGGKVMEIVCEALELSGSDADKYWKDVSKWVPKYLNKKRNNVMGVIKESLEYKIREDNLEIPEMEDLEALRTNTEGFEFICEHVISEIIGRAKFEKRARKELVSTFVTRSTEAFAVLLMDNFREMIIERGQKEKEKKVKKGTLRAPTTAKAKYTNKGRGAKKFRGWSKEGLQKYNSLMNKVRIDREEEAKKNYPVEKEYRRALIEVEESSESAKKRKMNGQEENEETMEMEIED